MLPEKIPMHAKSESVGLQERTQKPAIMTTWHGKERHRTRMTRIVRIFTDLCPSLLFRDPSIFIMKKPCWFSTFMGQIL